jgi:hypothetical protein
VRQTSFIPANGPARDLTAVNLGALNGKDIADVAKATLDVGQSMLAHWTELEPIVKQLTQLVRAEVANDEIKNPTRMLADVAGVVEKITRASGSVTKAAEGLARLTVLVMGGVPQRADPRQLSEKQLAGIVVEAVKRIKADTGVCPICAPAVIDVEARPS